MTEMLEMRPETRRRRKAERPQEILEAAFAEFSRNGYAMTTLDRIAERAGVTKGTIYVYFENKEHLFISMVREFTKAAHETVQEMFETHAGSTADLLRAQFSFIYQNIVEDRRRREVARMLIAEAPRFPELADRYYEEILGPCLELFKQAIQRGMDRGEIRKVLHHRLPAGRHRADRAGGPLDDDVRRPPAARPQGLLRRAPRPGAQRAAGEVGVANLVEIC